MFYKVPYVWMDIHLVCNTNNNTSSLNLVTDNCKNNILCFLQVICRFGSPETLITNQGREFVDELSAEF